jgi:hypothetical protein
MRTHNKAPEIHDFGFLGAQDPFFDDSDAFVVAITGGSVAQNLWKSSAEELAALMRSLPEVEGRPVRVICLAIFGYKQPQQLAGLSYFLAIGGRIDVLVNIDGFNEIANVFVCRRAVVSLFPHHGVHRSGLTDLLLPLSSAQSVRARQQEARR